MKRDRVLRPLEKPAGPPPRVRVAHSVPELLEEIREHFPDFEADLRANTADGAGVEIFPDTQDGARALLTVLVGLARKELRRRNAFALSRLSLDTGDDLATAERAAIQNE